jgi:hypothetical protein
MKPLECISDFIKVRMKRSKIARIEKRSVEFSI